MNTNMSLPETAGYLAMYIGPMYSGKSTRLIQLYKQFKFCNVSTLVINYAEDTRYSNESVLMTHDKQSIPCNLSTELHKDFPLHGMQRAIYDVYLINEAQFFPDIVEWVKTVISPPYNKRVYLCGLDGDFKRNVFGHWLDLIAYCDTVEKLTSFCYKCRKQSAIFSHRISHETQQKMIGSDSYIPLCRVCYGS